MRQEGKGMLLGTYEREGVPWSERETPWDFSLELLAPDLDRIAPSLEVGFRHYPPIEKAGIKKIINGPFTFAPDGNPIIGPVRGLNNYWLACGVMAGFSQGGGVGLALANWMVEGDPGADIWAMDVARFGDWTTMAYTNAKVRENYSRRFRIRFPNEELPAARPLRMTPVYDRLKAKGAVFGAAFGLEHALWFAPEGTEPVEEVTFRRSNAHPHVAAECRAVRDAVGLLEISSYAKYEVRGPQAEAWIGELFANRVPRVERILLSPMLNQHGKVIGDFTVARTGTESFLIFGSGIAEEYHMRWFEAHVPKSGLVLRSLRTELLGFAIAGPRSRELLSRLTPHDVANQAFPFITIRRMDVVSIPAVVGRISFSGELGYEIWVRANYQLALYELLMQAGADLGIRPYGARALTSMRLEKGFGNWARDFRPIYGPGEAGLDRFIAFEKPSFIGREAALEERAHGLQRRLVTLVVTANGADAIGDEPVFYNGEAIGWITSGGYGHRIEKSLALAYVPASLVQASSELEVEILGERRPAAIAERAPYDPEGSRMRS
jgi:dimethylglycine dehydrogenase